MERVKNIVGQGENAGYQHFLLSYYVFKRPLFQGQRKSGLCGKELTLSHTMTTFHALKENAF